MKYILLALALSATNVEAKDWPTGRPVQDAVQSTYNTTNAVLDPIAKIARLCGQIATTSQEFGKHRNSKCNISKYSEPVNQLRRQAEKVSNANREWGVILNQFR